MLKETKRQHKGMGESEQTAENRGENRGSKLMELKSIIGLAARGGAIPRVRRCSATGGVRARCCWGPARSSSQCGEGSAVPAAGRKDPASSEVIKKSFQTSAG